MIQISFTAGSGGSYFGNENVYNFKYEIYLFSFVMIQTNGDVYTLAEPTESKVAITPVASLRIMNPLATLDYPVLNDASLAFNLHFAIDARDENASAIYVSTFFIL